MKRIFSPPVRFLQLSDEIGVPRLDTCDKVVLLPCLINKNLYHLNLADAFLPSSFRILREWEKMMQM